MTEREEFCSSQGVTHVSTISECRALVGFVRSHYPDSILTTNSSNNCITNCIIEQQTSKRPAGCYVNGVRYGKSKEISIYFNTDNKDSEQHPFDRSICKVEIGRTLRININIPMCDV